MKQILNKKHNKHLIILVHGLNGSEKSWSMNKQRLVENLMKESLIKDNFNIAIFSYATNIFKINAITKLKNLILGFFFNRTKEKLEGFNVSINSISRTLESEIRVIHENYETITIISHSMGGLVTKSALTWLPDNVLKKIELFISLSVPHIGSNLAKLGKELLGDNPQIIDLVVMGEFTTQLNERYSNLAFPPKLIYQSGNQDFVVTRQSAIPPNVSIDYTISTEDDHFSVLLIQNKNNNQIFQRIIKELNILLQPFLSINVSTDASIPIADFITTLAPRMKIQVSFEGFTDDELKLNLNNGNITCSTVEELLHQIAKLTINKFPPFTVEREKNTSNYLVKRK